MKIVHVVMGKANPYKMNGVNKSAHNLSKFQHRMGLDVELWGITKNPHAATPAREYPLRLFQTRRNRFNLDKGLKDTIQALPVDTIIHFHGVLIPEFYGLSRELLKHNIRWVVSPRGAYSPTALNRSRFLKKLYFFLFEQKFLGQASAVHTLTPREKEWVQAMYPYPENRIHVIPNGEDKENIKFSFQAIVCADRPVFGFCGRLEHHHKGLDKLFEGFKQYRQHGGCGSLWMIGDGPSRGQLEEYARSNNLSSCTVFLGPLFGEEKFNHIANFDVFVHTSRWEGIPNAVLEAAALGKPLLLSKGTNMATEVSQWKCGIALADNTPDHIATAMREFEVLGDNNGLVDLGANATRMIEEKFSYKIVSKLLIDEVYKRLSE